MYTHIPYMNGYEQYLYRYELTKAFEYTLQVFRRVCIFTNGTGYDHWENVNEVPILKNIRVRIQRLKYVFKYPNQSLFQNILFSGAKLTHELVCLSLDHGCNFLFNFGVELSKIASPMKSIFSCVCDTSSYCTFLP